VPDDRENGRHRPGESVQKATWGVTVGAARAKDPRILTATFRPASFQANHCDPGVMPESRSIENDSSVVINVKRPDADHMESPRADRCEPAACVTIAAQLHYSRFVDMAHT
jgi:hypothetical protein